MSDDGWGDVPELCMPIHGQNGYAKAQIQPGVGDQSHRLASLLDLNLTINDHGRQFGGTAPNKNKHDAGFGEVRNNYNNNNSNHFGKKWSKKPRGKRFHGCSHCGDAGHSAMDCDRKDLEPRRYPPSSWFMPEDRPLDFLFKHKLEKGAKFVEFYSASVDITRGGIGGFKDKKIESFNDICLPEIVKKNLQKMGCGEPTPVQEHAIPHFIAGDNMMVCAETGCGKTVAFLLPLISKLLSDHTRNTKQNVICKPKCIIVVPTRELAWQIYNNFRMLADGTDLKCAWAFGGTSVRSNFCNVKESNATVLVATVGRLKHMLGLSQLGFELTDYYGTCLSLREMKYLIMDEADELMQSAADDGEERMKLKEEDKGFYDHLVDIFNPVQNKCQTIMFSATFPTDVQKLAADFLHANYTMITVNEIGNANKCITQEIVQIASKADKDLKLVEIVKGFLYKTLIFVEKSQFVDTVTSALKEAGVYCEGMRGDTYQEKRLAILNNLEIGHTKVVVSSGVMGRGLDIRGVQHVVLYDLPACIDQYVHRIGRAGRIGNSGRSTAFFYDAEDIKIAPALVKCMNDAGQVVPEWLDEIVADLDAPEDAKTDPQKGAADGEEAW